MNKAITITALLKRVKTLEAVQQRTPDVFLPPKEVPKFLPCFSSAESVRRAIRAEVFIFGKEAQMHGGKWAVNPYRYTQRLAEEQYKNPPVF